MSKSGRLFYGVALLLFAFTGFLAANAFSPSHQLYLIDIDGETFMRPTLTPEFVFTMIPAMPTATTTPLTSQTLRPPGTSTPILLSQTPETSEPPRTPTPMLLSPTPTKSPTIGPVEPTSTPTLTLPLPATNTPVLTPSPLPKGVLESEYPQKIEIGRSDSLRITLFRTHQETWVATVDGTEHTAEISSPQPIGTIDAPLEEAFGKEYTACAIALLEGQAFDIGEVTSGCQSLEQPEITWVWNIKPKSDALGVQIVNIRIEGQWHSTNNNPTIQRELFRTIYTIEVTKPFIGYINLGSVVSGLIGSGLSIPWIYDRVKELRQKKNKKKN